MGEGGGDKNQKRGGSWSWIYLYVNIMKGNSWGGGGDKNQKRGGSWSWIHLHVNITKRNSGGGGGDKRGWFLIMDLLTTTTTKRGWFLIIDLLTTTKINMNGMVWAGRGGIWSRGAGGQKRDGSWLWIYLYTRTHEGSGLGKGIKRGVVPGLGNHSQGNVKKGNLLSLTVKKKGRKEKWSSERGLSSGGPSIQHAERGCLTWYGHLDMPAYHVQMQWYRRCSKCSCNCDWGE